MDPMGIFIYIITVNNKYVKFFFVSITCVGSVDPRCEHESLRRWGEVEGWWIMLFFLLKKWRLTETRCSLPCADTKCGLAFRRWGRTSDQIWIGSTKGKLFESLSVLYCSVATKAAFRAFFGDVKQIVRGSDDPWRPSSGEVWSLKWV